MTIKCVNCDGKGYLVVMSWSGVKRPVKCGGCNGSGLQTVRS